ncbi:MAG: hypothetical protein BWK74_05695 [Desulfobacteraceae bacterium A6]|nr:MAG: hypothetical protein BWK74_05695 [Desulfobacteraceae bacterium A6]
MFRRHAGIGVNIGIFHQVVILKKTKKESLYGKKVILRSVPYWREHGTKKWIEDEEARYLCHGCRHKLFRGAKRCNKCGISVDLD